MRNKPHRTNRLFLRLVLTTLGIILTLATYLATSSFQPHPFLTIK